MLGDRAKRDKKRRPPETPCTGVTCSTPKSAVSATVVRLLYFFFFFCPPSPRRRPSDLRYFMAGKSCRWFTGRRAGVWRVLFGSAGRLHDIYARTVTREKRGRPVPRVFRTDNGRGELIFLTVRTDAIPRFIRFGVQFAYCLNISSLHRLPSRKCSGKSLPANWSGPKRVHVLDYPTTVLKRFAAN